MNKIFEFEEHIGKYRVLVNTHDIQNGAITPDKLNRRVWEALVSNLIKNTGSTAIGPDGYWYVDGVNTYVKAQGRPGRDADVWTIGEDNHWYLNGERTEFISKGEDGKDGVSHVLRVSPDGMSLEISSDGGETWIPFIKDFNLLRVLGYLDSKDKLPKNAEVGHIYSVWNAEADNGVTGSKGAYELYINTVLDWVKDGDITKVYSYDTELPSSAADGTTVLVPVYDLTLDKSKVDGYKVYKFSAAINGWVMALNTAEIYAAKEDIVNYGDNVYALVQGDEPNTYILYKRVVSWVKFGTNNSIPYKLVQDVNEGAEDNVPSGKAVKEAVNKVSKDVDDFKEEVKDTYGHYEENVEFVRVWLDNQDRILFGVQKDGNIYFGAGVPRQVKDYINTKLGEILGVADVTERIDSLKEVIDFLENYKNSDSLQKLLKAQEEKIENVNEKTEMLEKTKVDGEYVNNVEFVRVWLDNQDKVLFGIQSDGNVYFGAGVPKQIKEYIKMFKEINEDDLLKDTFSYEDKPGFIYAITDAEGTVLAGIKEDGTAYFLKLEGSGTGINKELQEKLDELEKKIGEIGKGDSAEVIDDIEERTEITFDSVNKIVSYRDSNGILHENVGIKTNKLILTDEGMSDFEKAVKGVADFSRNEVVELPEPKHYALLNLVLVGGLPRREGEVIKGYAEYYDFSGNSFKKSCAIEMQGQTSKHFAETGGKGNYTLDITDGSEVKFGSWVPQDSFHLKGCGKDVTKGFLATSYKLAYKLVERLDAKPNRDMALDDSETTERTASGDRFTDWGDSARCLPDGFPIEVYLDGKYWGLYALQLKKHRKNYSMKKSEYTTVLVESANYMSDGYQDGFWTGDIWWNAIEIRNPKDLVLKDGNTYDNDVRGELMGKKNVALNNSYWKYSGNGTAVNPVDKLWDAGTKYKVGDTAWMADDTGEWWYEFEAVTENSNEPCLVITDNELYDSGIKVHKNTIISKDIINTFPKRYIEVKNLIAEGNVEDAKSKFKEYFDYNACMVVFLFNGIMQNGDSIKKNTLWGIYKNGRIAPMLWDLDGVYGESFTGTSASAPSSNVFTSYINSNWPLGVFWTLFESDIKTTYATLRKEGVVSIETWRDVIYNQWINRIGAEAYERDIDKWPDTPSYRKDNINSEYWAVTNDDNSLSEWSDNTQYVTGNKVCYTFRSDNNIIRLAFMAVKDNINKVPLTKIYSYPYTGGYFNSPKRMEKWMIKQLELCDKYMGYTN